MIDFIEYLNCGVDVGICAFSFCFLCGRVGWGWSLVFWWMLDDSVAFCLHCISIFLGGMALAGFCLWFFLEGMGGGFRAEQY